MRKDEGNERGSRKAEKELRDINCTGVSIKGKSQQGTMHRNGRTGNNWKKYTNCHFNGVCEPQITHISTYLQGFTIITTSYGITIQICKVIHDKIWTRSRSSLYIHHAHLFTSLILPQIESPLKWGSAKEQLIKWVSL